MHADLWQKDRFIEQTIDLVRTEENTWSNRVLNWVWVKRYFTWLDFFVATTKIWFNCICLSRRAKICSIKVCLKSPFQMNFCVEWKFIRPTEKFVSTELLCRVERQNFAEPTEKKISFRRWNKDLITSIMFFSRCNKYPAGNSQRGTGRGNSRRSQSGSTSNTIPYAPRYPSVTNSCV